MSLNAESVLTMARGLMESRILLTGAELDLFTLLSAESLSAGEIAERIGGDPRAVTILLDALAAMDLLEKRQGRYRCPAAAAALLAADSPQSVLPMLRHYAGLWNRWHNLTPIVRGDPQTQTAGPTGMTPESLRAFIGAMHVVGAPQAEAVAAAARPGDARALLDVGGASGTYTLAFLRACAQMRATLFDLPPVIEMARERIQAAGMLDRVTLAPGDFYRDEIPGSHDLAFVSAIIHQNSPAQNVDLYRKIYRALQPGGRIVIRDHVMDPERTRPRAGAIFAVNMLVGTGGGNCYTFAEIADDLTQAGFERVTLLQQDERMNGLVEAYKPSI